MEIIFELAIYDVFYVTGSVLTYALSLGALRPETINWRIKKIWKFSTILHAEGGKRYLDWEWVIIVGTVFWVIVAFVTYYANAS